MNLMGCDEVRGRRGDRFQIRGILFEQWELVTTATTASTTATQQQQLLLLLLPALPLLLVLQQ